MESGKGYKYTAQRAIARQGNSIRKNTTVRRGSPLRKNITEHMIGPAEFRNNARLSAQTRKILGNVRNAYARGENVDPTIRNYIRRSVKEELARPMTVKQLIRKYQKYAAAGNK